MNKLTRLAGAALAALLIAGCGASRRPANPTPAATPAAAPDCDQCEARPGGQCLRHVENKPVTDDEGRPVAPTEARDFACDPTCCE